MLTPLAKKAALRTHQAFHPKARQAYDAMFRVFVAFCIISAVILPDINVEVIMSFLECLVENNCSCAMLENYMSAIKANCILYDLPYYVFDHPKIKYFIKSIKINRPLILRPHNTVDLSILRRMSKACLELTHGLVYRAVFLTGFFAFFRLSNLAPIPFPPSIRPGILLVMMYSSLRNSLKFSSNGRKPFNPEIQCSVLHSQNCRILPFVLFQH